MSQNPFEALGGGLDINALMQQAQQMQEQLHDAQRQLEAATVEGSVAGGAVTVTVNGVGELAAVSISPGVVEGDDPESLAELGDLIVAAYRDARSTADRLAEEQLGPLAGGAPGLPGLSDGASGAGPLGFQ